MQHHVRVEQTSPAMGTETKPTGRPNARLRQTVRDMVWSMLVVLVVVGIVMVLAWRPEPEAIKPVDAAPFIVAAAASADFDVLAPSGLDSQWRATSARWESTPESSGDPVLHIGYVTPAGAYAQLTEYAIEEVADATDVAYTTLFREQVGATVIDGDIEIGGATWATGRGDTDRVLIRVDGTRVSVLSGTASLDELSSLVRSLQPVSG